MSALIALSMVAVASPVTAAPQAVIDASADTTTVAPGETFNVTYELSNTGSDDATAGRIDLSTPTGINATSVSGDGLPGLDGDPPAVFYGLSGRITPGETRTTTVTYTVTSAAPDGEVPLDADGFLRGTSSNATATTSTRITVDKPSGLELSGSPSTVNTQPGERFNVTYQYTNNQSTTGLAGSIELNTSDNITPVAVSGDGFDGLNGQPPSVLYGASGPIPGGATLTTTVTYEVDANSPTSTRRIISTATIRNASGSDQLSTRVNIGASSIVDQYDTNGQPGIQTPEVLQAIVDLNSGKLTTPEVLQIIVAFNS
ncbi:hypothetical protein ACFQL1_00830 [Halomicroarcula sp. GCM10025709]|uniref:hypothetical protein n=1 Tax=Haloarcula TaxID=2237 RepID=UPI0024C43DF6|nr:hypothetical protein [Halomicroarcula sp. YJ-61-S]